MGEGRYILPAPRIYDEPQHHRLFTYYLSRLPEFPTVGCLTSLRATTCGARIIRLVANLLLEAGPACPIRGLDAVEPILIAAGSISEP
jgi:hypothetical protein